MLRERTKSYANKDSIIKLKSTISTKSIKSGEGLNIRTGNDNWLLKELDIETPRIDSYAYEGTCKLCNRIAYINRHQLCEICNGETDKRKEGEI